MKLSEFKQHLDSLSALNLLQLNGQPVPAHFHITEAGLSTKNFIDCGGEVRQEKNLTLQVWVANDRSHRLEPAKLKRIIGIYEGLFGTEDLEVEVEYQSDTIGRYGLEARDGNFMLVARQTACLASDSCGMPVKQKVKLAELTAADACCTPGGGCC